MPIKRYESQFHEEYLKVTLSSGKTITVVFKGGGEYPKPHGGTYVTDNKEIQAALEGRRNFKEKFKIVLVVPTKEEELQKLAPPVKPTEEKKLAPPPPVEEPVKAPEEPEEEIQEEEQPVDTEEAPEEPVKEVIEGPAAILDVETFQQVRNYLCKTYPGTTFADVRSKEAAKKMATEKNICFPNWKE